MIKVKDQTPTRMQGEPEDWYTRFLTYYLTQGIGATVVEAERLWMSNQEDIHEGMIRRKKSASSKWNKIARQYSWQARSNEYHRTQAIAHLKDRRKSLKATLGILVANADKAATELVKIAMGKSPGAAQLPAIIELLGMVGISSKSGVDLSSMLEESEGADVSRFASDPLIIELSEQLTNRIAQLEAKEPISDEDE